MEHWQTHAGALAQLQAELLAAIAAEDVDRLAALIARRGDLLAALAAVYASAPAERQRAVQPDVRELARQDRELDAHLRDARDRLAQQLARGNASGPPPSPQRGGLDRRA
jgi:hypothetical protein